jgi:hypothetical protein
VFSGLVVDEKIIFKCPYLNFEFFYYLPFEEDMVLYLKEEKSEFFLIKNDMYQT